MDASVIITTFQRSHFLSRAIKSVLLQNTKYDFEIIVIDDNGIKTQHQLLTEKAIEEYMKIDNLYYYPLDSNKGGCFARNYGISKAKGKYVFFLDDDDTYETNKIEAQIIFMEKNANLHGCLAPFKRLDPKGAEIRSNSNFPVVGDFINFSIKGNFFTPMLCIKKLALQEIGGFQEIDRFQDRFLMLHALKKDMVFGCMDEVLHTMYEHKSDRISNVSIKKTIFSLNKIHSFIAQFKSSFSDKEWKEFEINDLTMRATQYYLSNNLNDKLYGIKNYFKILKFNFNKRNGLNFIKSILNIFRIR